MREIKFRAWDKDYKRMFWNVQDAYDCLNVHHVEFPDDDDRHSSYVDSLSVACFGDMLGDEEYEIMQYTGLKDRNGKEIYEGDVVEADEGGITYEKWKGLIDYDRGCFVARWDIWQPEAKGFNDRMCLSCAALKNSEVIGNIYENPELVKEL